MTLRSADFVQATEKPEETLASPFQVSLALLCLELFDWTAMGIGRAANVLNTPIPSLQVGSFSTWGLPRKLVRPLCEHRNERS